MNTASWSGDKLGERNIIENDVITIHAELAAIREYVHELISVREIAASHSLDQIHRL